jgi:hypothetical protein
MEKERKYLNEEFEKLADRILQSEDHDDLDNLKRDCMTLYEELVIRLHEKERQQEQSRPVEMADAHATAGDDDSGEVKAESSPPKNKKKEEEQEYPTLSDLFVPTFNDIKEDMSQKEEFKDTVSLEETEKLFETKKEEIRQLSLNDRLLGSSIQVGLNDRIAFVNKLFNFSQSDFNKVLTRLNECSSREEALHYVQYEVKTIYNWKGKEELEERFISLIERKFIA